MANTLNAISLAIGLVSSDASVDSGAWQDYVWRVYQPNATMQMVWDWKRPQYVTVTLDIEKNKVNVRIKLTNNDKIDDDYVCITALFRNQERQTIAVFHENRHSNPRSDVISRSTVYLEDAKSIASVAIGTKQCRAGPHQDDTVYEHAKTKLGQVSGRD